MPDDEPTPRDDAEEPEGEESRPAERDAESTEREASDAEASDPGDAAERQAVEEEERAVKEEEDEFGIDQKRMPFTAHLVELRYRILVCVGTVGGAFVLFFLLLRTQLYWAMTLPVQRACEATNGAVKFSDLLVARSPTEMFVTSAYFCIIGAIMLTIPVTGYQLWMFVAPGLRRRERRAVVPILSIGTVLFSCGALFAYFVVVPVALSFLMMDAMKFQGLKLLWNIGNTLKFESVLLLVFGFAFEMPLVVVALTKVGVLSPEMLAKKRRHCVVAMFVVGALLTPPDIFTQLCLALPLVVLFEISIQVAKFFRPTHTLWEGWEEGDYADTWPDEPGPGAAKRRQERSRVSSAPEAPEPETTGEEDHDAEDYGEEYYDEDGYYEEGYYEDETDYGEEWEDDAEPADESPSEEAGGEPESGEEPTRPDAPDGKPRPRGGEGSQGAPDSESPPDEQTP